MHVTHVLRSLQAVVTNAFRVYMYKPIVTLYMDGHRYMYTVLFISVQVLSVCMYILFTISLYVDTVM